MAPTECRIAAEEAIVSLHDVDGHRASIDIALAAAFPESGSGAQRVRNAAAVALQHAQDELAEITTDPWPRRGAGELPAPRTELLDEGTALRLLYGSLTDPVLELQPLRIGEVLKSSG